MKKLSFTVFLVLFFSSVFLAQAVDVSVVVSDNAGGTQTLHLGLDPTATDGIDAALGEAELPPLPPSGVFDARLNVNATQSSLKDYRQGTSTHVGSKIHEIQYQVGTGTSILISANLPAGISLRLQDIILGTLIDVTLTGNSSYTVTNPAAFNKLKLTAIYNLYVPKNTYYIGAAGTKPGGGDPDFATLKAACDSLNKMTFTENLTFYITSDLNEAENIGLAINPTPYTVTFKPYAGIAPTITFQKATDANSGPSGAWVIGIPGTNNIAWNDMRTTRNIIIDGSNLSEGTTRDLTLQNASTAHRNTIPFILVGDLSNLTIKNCNIYYKVQVVSTSGNLFIGCIMIRSRNQNSTDFVPTNLTFENNNISSNFTGVPQNAQGIGYYQTGTPVPVTFPNGIVIRNNKIEGTRRAIALYTAGSTDIYNNEITLTQNISGVTSEAILANTVATGSVFNIYNNKISKISTMNSSASASVSGINIESQGTYNIYNNMIWGFNTATAATNPSCSIYGIRIASSTAIANIYFNTLCLPNLNFTRGTGTLNYRGIYFTDGSATVMNNIIYSLEMNDTSYCIYRQGALGTFISDYNSYFFGYSPSCTGYWQNAPAQWLSVWKTASGQDANSMDGDPGLRGASDLYLASPTSGVVGKGIAIPLITKDIDGQDRDTPPEIGADELPGVVPVELVAFNAKFTENAVTLNWKTATETNNKGFQVERKVNNSWESIGYVNGNGSTSEVTSYTFVDSKLPFAATVSYRLKQIDLDGTYTYSQVVEVSLQQPTKYELSQNYPNPFNPSTKISYTIPVDSRVTLQIYSVTGELVRELVNTNQSAGTYVVDFDASDLANGTYIYKITAGSFVQSKKLLLIK